MFDQYSPHEPYLAHMFSLVGIFPTYITRYAMEFRYETGQVRYTNIRKACYTKSWSFDMNWKFVSIHMDEKRLNHFDAWFAEFGDDLTEVAMSVLSQGYKLTVKYEANKDMFIATLVGGVDSKDNAKCSMSSWDKTLEQAIGMTLYKHDVIAKNGDWSAVGDTARRG